MSHYAKIQNGIVTKVIVAEPEFFDTFVDNEPGEWLRTSYNIRGGVYYDPDTNEVAADQSVITGDEGRERKNYAGEGFAYDSTRNAFIPPQPYPSWTLNETSCMWEAPVIRPDDDNLYQWDEEAHQADNTTGWVLVE
jgi:hypothetical protein